MGKAGDLIICWSPVFHENPPSTPSERIYFIGCLMIRQIIVLVRILIFSLNIMEIIYIFFCGSSMGIICSISLSLLLVFIIPCVSAGWRTGDDVKRSFLINERILFHTLQSYSARHYHTRRNFINLLTFKPAPNHVIKLKNVLHVDQSKTIMEQSKLQDL